MKASPESSCFRLFVCLQVQTEGKQSQDSDPPDVSVAPCSHLQHLVCCHHTNRLCVPFISCSLTLSMTAESSPTMHLDRPAEDYCCRGDG